LARSFQRKEVTHMGVGRLNAWVLDAFKTGAIDNTYRFVAAVQRMDGSILEWRGGRYQTKDRTWHQILGDPHGPKPGTFGYYDGVPGTGDPGHIVFEAPPGEYMVCASLHIPPRPCHSPGFLAGHGFGSATASYAELVHQGEAGGLRVIWSHVSHLD
jgi:hypothetical protein